MADTTVPPDGALRRLLRGQAEVEVVGEAGDGRQALLAVGGFDEEFV